MISILKYMAAVVAAAMACGCNGGEKGYVPQEGDLLFQVSGDGAFSEAIADATAWSDSVKFVHVGIVAIDEMGEPYVIEATGEKGVTATAWEDFMEEGAVVIKRVKVEFPAAEALERAKEFIGQSYDWSYYPDNGKMYCSELVWECFRWDDGSRIFTAKPMNFRDSQGNMPEFWVELYEKLGGPIPEGVLGTNPNDMSKDDILVEVFRSF